MFNRQERRRRAFLRAVEEGDTRRVEQLLARDPQLLHASHEDGRTAIHLAASSGQREVAALLLAKGADPNAPDRSGRTPLWCAIAGGGLAVPTLVEHGADVNASPCLPTLAYCLTIVDAAVARETARARYLANPVSLKPIARLLFVAEYLVENGADVNAVDSFGRSALSYVKGALDRSSPDTDSHQRLSKWADRLRELGARDKVEEDDARNEAKRPRHAGSTEGTPSCSVCGNQLVYLGSVADMVAGVVASEGSRRGLEHWLGVVCASCKLAFCKDCIDVTKSVPCPKCGQPTKPAARGILEQIGALGQEKR